MIKRYILYKIPLEPSEINIYKYNKVRDFTEIDLLNILYFSNNFKDDSFLNNIEREINRYNLIIRVIK